MQLSPFALERYFARYEFSAKFLLSSSDCESVAIGDLLELEPGAREAFHALRLGYTESAGGPGLRREICRVYATVAPEHVLVHTGAEEAIFTFMNAALQAGDHVVVHSPCYQSLREIAVSIGCDVTNWEADERNGWSLSVDLLRKSIRPNTRAIVLNTPHNPTGFLMPGNEFADVVRVAADHGLLLFSDEVYRESEHDPSDRLPAACDVYPGAVSLGVMSKTYGLPGLRIGWVATHDAALLGKMERVKDYTTICPGAPGEFLAELALRHRERLSRRNVEIITSNLTILDGFFSRYADRFSWIRPRAGPIAYPRFAGGDVDSFCRDLVTEAGVLLIPGSVFGDRDNHFRIGFGRKNLHDAVAHFEEFVRSRRRL